MSAEEDTAEICYQATSSEGELRRICMRYSELLSAWNSESSVITCSYDL